MIQHSYSWIAYTQRKLTEREICTIFTAALFTKATAWKQRKGPWTDEWIKMIWCTYTHTRGNSTWLLKEYDICSNMDGPRVILREIRQICHLHVESKVWHEWTYLQNKKQTHRHRKYVYVVTRESKRRGGIN